MPGSFIKTPLEDYPISISFLGLLPADASLASGTVSATDETTGLDATATVLESPTVTIDGDEVQAYVKAGTAGVNYSLHFLVHLSPGSPVPTLEESILMLVRDL